jgi:hypothetical protein
LLLLARAVGTWPMEEEVGMGGKGKVTSAKVAKKASAVLRDGRSSSRTRSVAASALAQAKGKGK